MQRSNTSGKNPTPTGPDRNQNTSSTEQTSPSSSAPTTAASFMVQDPLSAVTNNQNAPATLVRMQPDDLSVNPNTNLNMLATLALMSDTERVQAALEEQSILRAQQAQATSSTAVIRRSVIQHVRVHPYSRNPEGRNQAPQDQTQPVQTQAASYSLLHAMLTASSVRPNPSSDSSLLHQQQTPILRTLLEPTYSHPQLAQPSSSLSPTSLVQRTSHPTGYFKRPKELDSSTSAQAEQSTQAAVAPHLRYRTLPDALRNLHPSQLPARFRLPYIPNFNVLPANTEQPESMDALKALILERLRAGAGRQQISYEIEYRFPNLSWHPSPGQIDAFAKEAARIEGKGKGKGKNRQDKD